MPSPIFTTTSVEPTENPPTALPERPLVIVLSVLGLSQGMLVALTGGGTTRAIAIGLALVGLNVRLRALSVVAALVAANFCVHLWSLADPISYRVAQLSVLALYGATALSALIGFIPSVGFRRAFVVTTAAVAVGVGIEVAIPRVVPLAIFGTAVPLIDPRGNPLSSGDVQDAYGLVQALYPDNSRGYFREPSITAIGTDGVPPHSVAYSLNALGCRGRDYGIPNLSGQRRIVVLGGGGAFGVGVHEPDTLASQLEQALNSTLEARREQVYEVINCGTPGLGTADQLQFYEGIASRYDPDVVLLAMSDRDNLSRSQEERLGYVYEGRATRLEELFFSLRLLQWTRHEGRRPFEYSSSADEVGKFAGLCRLRGVELAVVVFRHGEMNDRWGALVNAVSERTEALAVPFLDVGPAILLASSGRELAVHAIDPHPNEVAHRAAAAAIERLLSSEQLLF